MVSADGIPHWGVIVWDGGWGAVCGGGGGLLIVSPQVALVPASSPPTPTEPSQTVSEFVAWRWNFPLTLGKILTLCVVPVVKVISVRWARGRRGSFVG